MTFSQSELVEMLKNPASYAIPPKSIKLRETDSSYLFEGDDWLYKIKKEGNEFPTLAVKEAYCREECRLSLSFNPNWTTNVLPIVENNGGIKIGATEGEPVEYALKMGTLPEQWLLSGLLENNAVSKKNKRLFSKRHQKGRIVHGHGAFLPEHIFVGDTVVRFISPQEVHRKLADLDVANDVSSLTVELTRLGKHDLVEIFLNHYFEISNDLELQNMMPLYQTYCALKQGVRTCELKVARQDEKLGTLAMEYFNLAVNFSREIPRA